MYLSRHTVARRGEKRSMVEIQKAMDEDLKLQNLSKADELKLQEDLTLYHNTLRSGMQLTHKGSAKDVLDRALFMHKDVRHSLLCQTWLTFIYQFSTCTKCTSM